MSGLEVADLGNGAGCLDGTDQKAQSQRFVINSDDMQKDHLQYILRHYSTQAQEIQYILSVLKGLRNL